MCRFNFGNIGEPKAAYLLCLFSIVAHYSDEFYVDFVYWQLPIVTISNTAHSHDMEIVCGRLQ